MKKLTLLMGVLMIAGASFAHDGKSCCKKNSAKKECCAKNKSCCKKEAKTTTAPAKKA